jgi:hypothetical protein
MVKLRFPAFVAAALAASACSQPGPEARRDIALPNFHDANAIERECRCVMTGQCAIVDVASGRSESRNFECRWQDREAGRAICTWVSRFFASGADERDEPWHQVDVALSHAGEKGWCWGARS